MNNETQNFSPPHNYNNDSKSTTVWQYVEYSKSMIVCGSRMVVNGYNQLYLALFTSFYSVKTRLVEVLKHTPCWSVFVFCSLRVLLPFFFKFSSIQWNVFERKKKGLGEGGKASGAIHIFYLVFFFFFKGDRSI